MKNYINYKLLRDKNISLIPLHFFILLAEKKSTSEVTFHHKCVFVFLILKLENYEQSL